MDTFTSNAVDNDNADRLIPSLDDLMVKRECRNKRCPNTFRVLNTSPQETCSSSCDIEITENPKLKMKKWKNLQYVGPRHRENFKPEPAPKSDPCRLPTKPKKPHLEPVQAVPQHEETKPEPMLDVEANWKRRVNQARVIVRKMNKNRLEIARLALEACDIQLGGGNHWKKYKDVFTLKKFAEEIGVTYKTLHGWVSVVKNVVDKLPEGYYDEEEDYHAARSAANQLNRKSTEEEVKNEFDKWKARGTDAHYLLQLHRRVRSGAYFIEHRADLSKLDVETLKELRNNAQKIVTALATLPARDDD